MAPLAPEMPTMMAGAPGRGGGRVHATRKAETSVAGRVAGPPSGWPAGRPSPAPARCLACANQSLHGGFFDAVLLQLGPFRSAVMPWRERQPCTQLSGQPSSVMMGGPSVRVRTRLGTSPPTPAMHDIFGHTCAVQAQGDVVGQLRALEHPEQE